MTRSLIFALILMSCRSTSAHEATHSDSGERPGVGPTKAVIAVDHDRGFQLSPKAISTLGVQYAKPMIAARGWKIPSSAWVHVLNEVGFYRARQGWIEFQEVEFFERQGSEVFVRDVDLKADDDVAVQGVPLLRVTDIEVSDP